MLARQATNQYALAQILLYRLHNSPACRTEDPAQADLFYIPVLAHPKGSSEWGNVCKAKPFEPSALSSSLPHLTARTAARHFMVVSKGHYCASRCEWWKRPTGLLASVVRLAYSHTANLEDTAGVRAVVEWERGRKRALASNGTADTLPAAPMDVRMRDYIGIMRRKPHEYPNLFSVPYPSSVHWTTAAASGGDPTATLKLPPVSERPKLMLFIGKFDHGDLAVRQRIKSQCLGYADERVCTLTKCSSRGCARELLMKGTARFCLEPAGDSPFRKSLSDSLAFGCVPVLFHNFTDAVAPWFWGAWRQDARVLIDRDAFVSGAIDLRDKLSAIPARRVEQMARTIARNKRSFQYAIDDVAGDAVDIIVRRIHRRAAALEHGADERAEDTA